MRFLPLLLSFSLLIGCSGGGSISASNAWIAEAPPTAKVLAGYFNLTNKSKTDWTLTSLASPDFDRVEVHTMEHAGGMMKMRKLDELTVAAGAAQELKPGGTHLMMIGPKRSFKEGDAAQLTLELKDTEGTAKSITIEAFVMHQHPEEAPAHEH